MLKVDRNSINAEEEQCSTKSAKETKEITAEVNSNIFNVKLLEAESILKAVADRTRMKLLKLLTGGEMCVCQLVNMSGMSQPTVSNSLGILEKAGMVRSERRGKWHHYSLTDNEIIPMIMKLLEK